MLEYTQLGHIRETNTFAYADQSIEKEQMAFLILAPGLIISIFITPTSSSTDQSPDQSKVIVSPKLNIQYTLNTKTQLYLKTGKGFHSNDARVVVFNRGYDILPAAYGADLGVLLKPTRNLLVNVAAWYLYLQQEFVYVGDEGVVEPSGKTKRIGIDLSARYQFNNWLFADANLNIAKPRSVEEPKGENYIPLAPTFTSTGG